MTVDSISRRLFSSQCVALDASLVVHTCESLRIQNEAVRLQCRLACKQMFTVQRENVLWIIPLSLELQLVSLSAGLLYLSIPILSYDALDEGESERLGFEQNE